MEQFSFFPYSWHIDEDEEETTGIRIYGIDSKNSNVCVRINNFTPFVYLELPENIIWTESMVQKVSNKLKELLGKKKPIIMKLVYKKRLYYAHIDSKGRRKTFPYLFVSFSHPSDIRTLSYKIRTPINIIGIGYIKLRMHEQDASPILQFISYKSISTAGWIDFSGKRIEKDDQITRCDHEFKVRWKNVTPNKKSTVASPLIMGFDIEVNSTNPSAMPRSDKPGDKVFQISCVLFRHGEDEKNMRKFLLTLGEPDPKTVGKDTEIHMYETEHDLLIGYTEFIQEENPNIIVGYNILTFDIPYMIDRAKINYCIFEFDQQGFNTYGHAKEKTIKWSSSAYGNQTFQFLDAEGRLYVDLLPLVKRDYKMDNYKLKTISTFFLGSTKDPLSVKGIFKCYRIGIKKNEGVYSNQAKKAMGIVGKYCVQDSALVIRLFNKLQTWIGLCEMAKTCSVPIFYLYTQGQQIKVYSQLYKYCMDNNFVVEKDGYIPKDNEHFVGATVFTPIAGVYDRVLPFDFASLYPTTIIAYNIDYSTLVLDPSIPDRNCHVMEWEDHVGCVHDKSVRKQKPKHVMCDKRYFRFLKKPKGVMPTVLQNLLDARANTRKQIKIIKNLLDGNDIGDNDCLVRELISDVLDMLEKGIEIPDKKRLELITLTEVLDKRQLAYKVSANSMYGAMGVTRGYLPFMPGAMCTTAMGRLNIGIVAKVIPEKFGGELIYGDTDCVTGEMPVLLRWIDQLEPTRTKLCYKTMETISDGNWTRINTNKEISSPQAGYQIWSDQGFTDIVNVVRCGIVKPLSRVLTHIGVVTCSNEHSLLRENLESVTPVDIKIKDKLCTSELPLPDDTPKYPIYENKLTAKLLEEYEIPDVYLYETGLSAELAFVWGVFFADGSCGSYECGPEKSIKSTWAISKKDNKLLERCMNILKKHETGVDFKILDTIKSSHVNKLVAKQYPKKLKHTGDIKRFVERYRDLFYDNRHYKKIPDIILNSPLAFRQAFYMGYYTGDGSKKDPAISITNKGAIGSAGIFFLMRSIGYQVSVNTREDKPDIYKLTVSTPDKKFLRVPNAVKKIIEMKGEENGYIYDIQTRNHHFSAGVGQLVVHNSNYIVFPKLKTAAENWDHAEYVASEVTKMFPSPIKLEFEEEIYWRFFILTKKRYMYKKCYRDGIVDQKIGKKGVLLARRDNSMFIRNAYETLIMMVFNKATQKEIILYVIDVIDNLCSHFHSYKDFVVTKSIGSHDGGNVVPFINEKGKKKGKMGDYTVPLLSTDDVEKKRQFKLKNCNCPEDYYIHCLPAIVQLAERMRQRGQRVDPGTRIEYVISSQGGHKAKQYEKVEDATYFGQHSSVLNLDYMYYLKLMCNPFDDVLNILFDKDDGSKYKFQKNFVLNQYNYRLKFRTKVLEELLGLFKPKITLDK
jgi:DNA polymerase elongation subunit (family B)